MNGTDFRIFYEKYGVFKAAEHFNKKIKDVEHLSKKDSTAPFDLLLGDIRFDVKFSNPVVIYKGKKPVWDFSLRKVRNGIRQGHDGKYCDYVLAIGMKNGIPKKTFLIPLKETPTNHLRISIEGHSKYHQYEMI